jgi:hypothetical protein
MFTSYSLVWELRVPGERAWEKKKNDGGFTRKLYFKDVLKIPMFIR